MTCDTCKLELPVASKKLGRCSHCRRTAKTRTRTESQKFSGRIVGDAMAKVLEGRV